MHIIVSNSLTNHAIAWSEFGKTPVIGLVDYRPYLDLRITKVFSLNPTDNSLEIDGERHHAEIRRENYLEDVIWFWK